jgi:dephospho-CoA kinase
MLRVGLTGGLGSGKSTVAALLRSHGAAVIEADELGRALMEPGQECYNKILARFGNGILTPDARIDRKKLAALVFTPDNNRLHELNAIIHPAVIAAQARWTQGIFAADPTRIAVVESALIFEVERDAIARGESETLLADWRNRFNFLIVVNAPEELRIARYLNKITANAPLTPAEHEKIIADAKARIAHQIPDSEKIRRADFVIDNSGDLHHLTAAVTGLWAKLQSSNNAK